MAAGRIIRPGESGRGWIHTRVKRSLFYSDVNQNRNDTTISHENTKLKFHEDVRWLSCVMGTGGQPGEQTHINRRLTRLRTRLKMYLLVDIIPIINIVLALKITAFWGAKIRSISTRLHEIIPRNTSAFKARAVITLNVERCLALMLIKWWYSSTMNNNEWY
jgi:hypothetical protein